LPKGKLGEVDEFEEKGEKKERKKWTGMAATNAIAKRKIYSEAGARAAMRGDT